MSRYKDKMKKHIRCSIYDTESFERRLEQLALEGWLLEQIGGVICTFRRCEPKRLHYSAIFLPKAPDYTPTLTARQLELSEMCEHTGWTLAAYSAKLHVFYSEEPDPVPLETDPAMTLSTMHSIFKKSYLPGYLMYIFVAVLRIAFGITMFVMDPLWFSDSISVVYCSFMLSFYSCLLITCLAGIVMHAVWYKKAKLAAAEGGDIPRSKLLSKWLQYSLLCPLVIGVIVLLSSPVFRGILLPLILIIAITEALIYLLHFLQRRKVSRTVYYLSMFAGLIVLILLIYVIAFGYAAVAVSNIDYTALQTASVVDLPLKTGDIFEVDNDIYISTWSAEESALLGVYEAEHKIDRSIDYRSEPTEDAIYRYHPDIEYTVYDIRLDMLRSLYYDAILDEELPRHYPVEQLDAGVWGANSVYYYEGLCDTYILCYDSFVAVLEIDMGRKVSDTNIDETLSSKQMAIIGQKLLEAYGK